MFAVGPKRPSGKEGGAFWPGLCDLVVRCDQRSQACRLAAAGTVPLLAEIYGSVRVKFWLITGLLLLGAGGACYLAGERFAALLVLCGLLSLGGAHSISHRQKADRTRLPAPRQSPSGCACCGQSAPLAKCHYHFLVSFVVANVDWGGEKSLCRRCVHGQFWTSQLTTLLLGWWSLSGLFLAPAFLLSNIEQYHRGLRSP